MNPTDVYVHVSTSVYVSRSIMKDAATDFYAWETLWNISKKFTVASYLEFVIQIFMFRLFDN